MINGETKLAGAYSKSGLTYVVNASMRLLTFLDKKQRCIIAARCLARATMLKTCLSNLRSGSTITPKSVDKLEIVRCTPFIVNDVTLASWRPRESK